MKILTRIDFLLLPVFLLVGYLFVLSIRNRKYKGTPLYGYFLNAWSFRVVGAFLTALMYQYYYGYGDTFFYYIGASDITKALLSNFSAGMEMLLLDYDDWSPLTYNYPTYHMVFTNDGSLLVVRIAGFLGWFSGGSYFGMSLGMTAFAFGGCWRLYRVFYDLYPHLHRPLAFAILYLPSVCFWGTGVMKDSLTIGALGFFVHGFYYFFINRSRLMTSAFWMILGSYLMIKIKIYVFIAVLPASIVWLAFMYQKGIKNAFFKLIFGPILLLGGLAGGALGLQVISSMSEHYSLDKVLKQAAATQWWISLSTENSDGTGYSLGEIDPSIGGMLRVMPAAINVTLFRPYLWEARKPIVMPSALESLFALLFTFYVIYKIGIRYLVRAILFDPVVPFCLVFALFFAFAVGFTSMNFGALARYKIPCMPFYFAALILLLNQAKQAVRTTTASISTNTSPAPTVV